MANDDGSSNNSADKDKSDDSGNPLTALIPGTESLNAVGMLKKLLHRTSSSHITSREKTAGFEFLDIKANAQSSRGLPKFLLEKLIQRFLVPFAKTSQTMKDIVHTFEEMVKYDVDQHQEQFFNLISDQGNGYTKAIFLYYERRDDGKYNFKKLLFSGSFRLAADMVILRKTKSGFFSSSSEDVIKYLPRRGITEADINALLRMIVPGIANVMNEFIPPQKTK